MKKCKIWLLSLMVVSVLTSCVSTGVQEEAPVVAPYSAKEITQPVAEAFIAGDYEDLAVMLSPELRKQLSEEIFVAMLKELEINGELVEVEYLGELRRPVVVSALWRIVFAKEDTDSGNVIYNDRLLRIVAGVVDNRITATAIVVQ